MKFLPVLLMLIPLLCSGQGAPVSTPVEPATGLPLVLRVLPKPEVEPWSKITAKQRWDGYVAFTFSPFAGLGAASGAAISQAINSPEEWGQGWGAYGIRVTSSYGATLVGNTVTFGTSALFHEDNRYFRSHSDGFFGRLGHVIGSPYVARNDTGRRRFSASMFMGSAAYSGVQLAWSPSSWQGWDDVGINYLIWYGQVAGVNLVKEFYPTMVRHFQLKKKPKPGDPKFFVPKWCPPENRSSSADTRAPARGASPTSNTREKLCAGRKPTSRSFNEKVTIRIGVEE